MHGLRTFLPLVVVFLCIPAIETTGEIQSLPLISAGLGVVPRQDTSVAVAIDIEPRTCPNPLDARHDGQLPVAVLGSYEFDVTAVDVGSILLAGVAPIHASFRDVAAPVPDGSPSCACTTDGPDGSLDLLLKFPVGNIVDVLDQINDGDVISLTLTGTLLPERGGTPFSGSDCIVVRLKKPHK